MPDPARLLHTLHQAARAFRDTPGRQGRFLQVPDVHDVLVAGDLHGHLANFKRVLDLADLGKNRRRHLVLQEVVHGPHRYPGGGDQSHRLLDLTAALKCQYPERVHLLLGNHELSQWTRRAILKADEDLNQLFLLGVQNAYGDHADAIYAAYEELFAVLPAGLRTPNRVFLSHSLPAAARLETWELTMICRDRHEPEDYKPGGCIHAIVWGRDLTQAAAERFLQKVDADLLITGHIPSEAGFQVPNDRQLVLDCMGAKACCCLFPADRRLKHSELLSCLRSLHAQ